MTASGRCHGGRALSVVLCLALVAVVGPSLGGRRSAEGPGLPRRRSTREAALGDLRAGSSPNRRRVEQAARPRTLATGGRCAGRSAGEDQGSRPLLVAVGASFTAGVGAASPTSSWPYLVADALGWRVKALGVPGAGYVRAGYHDAGPLSREVAELDLPSLHPSLVVLQAGHNDVGEPLELLYRRVHQLVSEIHREVPHARLALITVFVAGGRRPSLQDELTNATIAMAAARTDPGVFMLDPLTGHWSFPRVADDLHPDPAGYRWIAHRVTERLRSDGIFPVARMGRRPLAAGPWGSCHSGDPLDGHLHLARAA